MAMTEAVHDLLKVTFDELESAKSNIYTKLYWLEQLCQIKTDQLDKAKTEIESLKATVASQASQIQKLKKRKDALLEEVTTVKYLYEQTDASGTCSETLAVVNKSLMEQNKLLEAKNKELVLAVQENKQAKEDIKKERKSMKKEITNLQADNAKLRELLDKAKSADTPATDAPTSVRVKNRLAAMQEIDKLKEEIRRLVAIEATRKEHVQTFIAQLKTFVEETPLDPLDVASVTDLICTVCTDMHRNVFIPNIHQSKLVIAATLARHHLIVHKLQDQYAAHIAEIIAALRSDPNADIFVIRPTPLSMFCA